MATDTSDSITSGSALGSALQDSIPQNSATSQSTPPSPFHPPLFIIGDGDVVISIMPGPKNEIRVSSTLLGEKSHIFSAMLSSRWDYNKRTVEEVCLADGTSSLVRRFELVFDNNGSYLLGKVCLLSSARDPLSKTLTNSTRLLRRMLIGEELLP